MSKVKCPVCGEMKSTYGNGMIILHTEKDFSRCSGSFNHPNDLCKVYIPCPDLNCGQTKVGVLDNGLIQSHYPDPSKTYSAEKLCRLSGTPHKLVDVTPNGNLFSWLDKRGDKVVVLYSP